MVKHNFETIIVLTDKEPSSGDLNEAENALKKHKMILCCVAESEQTDLANNPLRSQYQNINIVRGYGVDTMKTIVELICN